VLNILIEQEKLILNTLKFNMSVPTPYVFMRRFLKAADSDKQVNHRNLMITVSQLAYQKFQ
jgi:hypothetical protein